MTDFPTRRDFLKQTALAATALAGTSIHCVASGRPSGQISTALPWYRRTLRWGQTNITEMDPERYDISWWREYWQRTQTQGVIINAGGIVAYYPSQIPLHRPAQHLDGRDLFGELCRAAHEDGLVVFARMDSNRAHEGLYRAHPDWFALDRGGQPYKAGELFVTCVNSPYYEEYIPAILREIIERFLPEGFTDNSWSGLGRGSPCFCENCQKRFRERTGQTIPREKNWSDPLYRQWIQWNYQRRLELWDLNNRVTRTAGGADCLWVGMNSGSISGQSQSFRDCREICRRAEIIMLDHQSRNDASGFQQNGETGKLVHGLLGWDKLVPE
ncbi:MAG: beta-galactosidase, partial [Tepidisphaeraceae bacterium]